MRLTAILTATAACLLLAAAGMPAAAQDSLKSTSDVDPGAVRYFDPDGRLAGRIEQTLPFDVPFYLRIPVDDTVTRITGRYVGDTDPLICENAFPSFRLNVDYGFGPRAVARSEQRQIQPISFTRFVDVNEPPIPVGKYAELNVVRGLLPNRYYCFELTRQRKAEGKASVFKAALYAAVEKTLRGKEVEFGDESGPKRQAVYDQIRDDMIAAIDKQLGTNERLLVPPGTFLDKDAKNRSLPASSRRSFDLVLQGQQNRELQINTIERLAGKVEGKLDDAVQNKSLGALSAAATQVPPQELLVPVFRDAKDSLSALAGLDQTNKSLNGLATGEQGLATTNETIATSLAVSWLPEDLSTRVTNLAQTDEGLQEVLDSAAMVLNGSAELQGLISSDGTTLVNNLKDLQTSLGSAIGELAGVIQVVDQLSTNLQTREKLLQELVANISREIVEVLRVEGSTTANFEVRANWYMGMDLGVAWAQDVEDFFAYVGTNIYFRPVNKRAPLRWSDFRRGQRRSELMKRLSLTIGLVVNDLARNCQEGVLPDGAVGDCRVFEGVSQENITQGLVGDKPLVVTGGLRLNDFFRLSVGALVFKEQNPDPLRNESRLTWAPLVSISIDWNLRGSIRNRVTQEPFPAK